MAETHKVEVIDPESDFDSESIRGRRDSGDGRDAGLFLPRVGSGLEGALVNLGTAAASWLGRRFSGSFHDTEGSYDEFQDDGEQNQQVVKEKVLGLASDPDEEEEEEMVEVDLGDDSASGAGSIADTVFSSPREQIFDKETDADSLQQDTENAGGSTLYKHPSFTLSLLFPFQLCNSPTLCCCFSQTK